MRGLGNIQGALRLPGGAVGISVRDPANQATMQSPSFPPLGLQLLRLVELLASPTVSSLLGEKHYVTAQEISTGSALVSSLTARVLIGQKLVK